jgi:hypothetical protein
MKVNNMFAKPILKAIFYIVLLLGSVNVAVLLTHMQPFTDLAHISIAVSLFISAGLIMSRNFFIRYNSEDAVLEIERAGLFSSKNTIHSSQLGFVKAKIQGYSVDNTWYGGSFTLVYSTSRGKAYSKKFPVIFGSKETMLKMNEDLGNITNQIEVAQPVSSIGSKVLKNSPAFS